MALKLVKETEQQLTPHRQALSDNLRAIKETRARYMVVAEKDRAAAADMALADATQGRIATMTEQIDTLRAEASYNGDPPPDLRHLEKQLAEAQTLHKTQSNTARAAANVRVKFTADMAALHNAISTHGRETQRLLWTALREDVLSGLAEEFLAKEAAFMDVHRRVFAAAVAADQIAVEQCYGQFVRSGNVRDTNIGRPEHAAFDANPLMPEAAQAVRNAYLQSVVTEAQILINKLMEQ
jgi:hypothetical protein